MALLIHLSIYSQLGEEQLDEFVEVINRGRPEGYRPGAVDLTEYEVRLRTDTEVLQTARVQHLRSQGARRLAHLALAAVDEHDRPMSALQESLAFAGVELAGVTVAVRPWSAVDAPDLVLLELQLARQLGTSVRVVAAPAE